MAFYSRPTQPRPCDWEAAPRWVRRPRRFRPFHPRLHRWFVPRWVSITMPKCPRDRGVWVVSSWFFTCEKIYILWKCLSAMHFFWVSNISKKNPTRRPSGKKEKNKWRFFNTNSSQLENYWNPPSKIEGWNPPRKSRCLFCSPTKMAAWRRKSSQPRSIRRKLEGRWIQLPCGACRRRMLSLSHSRRCRRVLDHRTGEHKKPFTKNQEIIRIFLLKQKVICQIQFVLVSPTCVVEEKYWMVNGQVI